MKIYRLASGPSDTPHLIDLSNRLFGVGQDFKLGKRGTGNVLRSGAHVVEIAPESGGAWAADESQLFKPSVKAVLPTEAITYDNTDEGRKLAQYAKASNTLIDAWFRTAKEIQPATNGEAAPAPTWWAAMWTTC